MKMSSFYYKVNLYIFFFQNLVQGSEFLNAQNYFFFICQSDSQKASLQRFYFKV